MMYATTGHKPYSKSQKKRAACEQLAPQLEMCATIGQRDPSEWVLSRNQIPKKVSLRCDLSTPPGQTFLKPFNGICLNLVQYVYSRMLQWLVLQQVIGRSERKISIILTWHFENCFEAWSAHQLP